MRIDKEKISFHDFTRGMNSEEKSAVIQTLGVFYDVPHDEFVRMVDSLNERDFQKLNKACERQVYSIRRAKRKNFYIKYFIAVFVMFLLCFLKEMYYLTRVFSIAFGLGLILMYYSLKSTFYIKLFGIFIMVVSVLGMFLVN